MPTSLRNGEAWHIVRSPGRAAEAYEMQVALAREAFAAFIPRFDGNEEPRTRWLSDRRQCRRGAQAIGRMLQQESAAVAAISQVAGD